MPDTTPVDKPLPEAKPAESNLAKPELTPAKSELTPAKPELTPAKPVEPAAASAAPVAVTQKAPDEKPVEKTAEQKAEELKAAEQRLTERQAEEQKAAAQKALDKQFLEAAKKGNVAELKDLLAKGANLNAADDGNTGLFYAAQHGRRDTVLFFLEQGLPLNVKNRIGSTPLTGAAGGGHKEIAQMLYDLGANPAENNLTGMSPLGYARSASYTDMIALLSQPRNNPVEVSFTRQTGDRTLQEIFNFTHQDRVTLIRKGENGPVEAMQRDNFADIKNESDLRRAFDLYKKRGGTITESAIFASKPAEPAKTPAPEKKSGKKSWLPWKRS